MTATTVERPLRRDAARNRALLLAAAMDVFAESGLSAPVEEVARRAGVGVGTLYRRFPSKEALVEAVAAALGDHLVDLAAGAARLPRGEGFEAFLHDIGELQARYGAALAALWLAVPEEQTRQELQPRLRRLLREAQQTGRARADLVYEDIALLLWSMASVAERTRHSAPHVWQRHLEVLAAGLRPDGRPLRARPLTPAQLERLRRV